MNGSTTFNSDTAVGDVLTVTLIIKANGYKISGVQIDGMTPNIDLDWVGGTAPVASGTSGYDVYTLIVIKTASTPAYHIIGSKVRVSIDYGTSIAGIQGFGNTLGMASNDGGSGTVERILYLLVRVELI